MTAPHSQDALAEAMKLLPLEDTFAGSMGPQAMRLLEQLVPDEAVREGVLRVVQHARHRHPVTQLGDMRIVKAIDGRRADVSAEVADRILQAISSGNRLALHQSTVPGVGGRAGRLLATVTTTRFTDPWTGRTRWAVAVWRDREPNPQAWVRDFATPKLAEDYEWTMRDTVNA